MVLKYRYKNFRSFSQTQKYRRGSYSYGSGSSSRAAISSARKIKYSQKRLKKSSRPIRMEFYKKYHRIQKRQKRRSFVKQPAKRHVYSAKTKSKFYYGRHFAKSAKSKKSVKRISSKFSTYKKETRKYKRQSPAKKETRTYKRKSPAIVVPKKVRKQIKKTVSHDGIKKRKYKRSSRSLLKFLKTTIPLAKKKTVYIRRSRKEKFTSKNNPAQTTSKKLSVVKLKDCVAGSDDNINKTDVHVASTSYSDEFCASTSRPNIDSNSKELETAEERGEHTSTGNADLTAVKGSMDLTATVDIDLTTRVDSVDLTELVEEVDLTQTPLKDIVDHRREVEKEKSEIINLEAPMEDEENAYDELMTKRGDPFNVKVD